jgi:hypothetical protein
VLFTKCCCSDEIKVWDRRAGHVAHMGLMRNVYRILVGKLEGQRSRHRWEDNIKMDLEEIGYQDKDWIHLV